MKKARILWFVLAIVIGGVLSYAAAQHKGKHAAAPAAPKESVTVELKKGDGTSVGKAVITEIGKGVRINLALENLPPGVHAIHFHDMAKCEGPAFESSGGHFNPDSKQHGLKNPKGPHAGDMLNFTVKKDGKATQTVTDTRVTMGTDNHSLFGGNGTSLVIHEKADDFKTDPSGNSGGRIACGVVSKP